ncbi:MAG: TonB-dependent receptor [Bacteroidales bacterium]|nr:TonB-dependent receptor [Bacteroidales bacterium]
MKDSLKKGDCFKRIARRFILAFLLIITCSQIQAQNGKRITGIVTDDNAQPLPGVTVMVQGTTVGTITDLDGKYVITASNGAKLIFTFVGYEEQIVTVGSSSTYNVSMNENTSELNEVVVVGYGQQKKANVVGAISQTTGKVLERAGGVSNIGAALTGNLPGVVTTQGTGMPGEEDPKIVIRGVSSWNSTEPLVLVDGIERSMNSVDISSVESISVLKDASATAIYGVQGANGVILITTKRGKEGTAHIEGGFSTTIKSPSKLPNKLDSYDALMARNEAIEHELSLNPDSWQYIRSMDFINNYRNQTTVEQQERYANVNWQDYLFKDYALSYQGYVNISGGTKAVKYYAAADYVNEGDLFRIQDNGRGYDCGYNYQRINVRSNLDFNITKSTLFKVNIAGSNAIKKNPWSNMVNNEWQIGQQWAGAYNIAPDVFLGKYSDGTWGFYPNASNVSNSAENMSLGGATQTATTTITTDFTLEQDLDFWVKGLKLVGRISWDNKFVEGSRGINDLYNSTLHKWINPETGQEVYKETTTGYEKFKFFEGRQWSTSAGGVDNNQTFRKLYYQFQINYNRKFGKNNVGLMGVFDRNEEGTGSAVPSLRENWSFRASYDWDGKYFLEATGSYNGSERFADKNRFAFFPAVGVNWIISEEPFMKNLKDKHMIDILKIRANVGQSGSDFLMFERWMYLTQWEYGEKVKMSNLHEESIYERYRESVLGNEDVHWEVSTKANIALDFNVYHGIFSGSIDFFKNHRTDILIRGVDRSVPDYFGATPPTINKGEVDNQGFELELKVDKTFQNKIRVWGNFNLTHNEDEVKVKDDKELTPNYQKAAGYANDQYKSHLDAGFLNNYDQVYGSPAHDINDNQKLPGDLYIIDFNSDGIINTEDEAPIAFSSNPQNTYNATIGVEYKGFSCFAQFYGVTNVTRDVVLHSLTDYMDNVYDLGDWWSADGSGEFSVPRWATSVNYNDGTNYLYDGSFIRLKNVELAYQWNEGWIKKLGMSYFKVYVNGNNLWLWTRMPDDREANLGGGGMLGAYPTVKRYNIGVKFAF